MVHDVDLKLLGGCQCSRTRNGINSSQHSPGAASRDICAIKDLSSGFFPRGRLGSDVDSGLHRMGLGLAGYGGIPCGLCSNARIASFTSYEEQLPNKQGRLNDGDNDQPKSESFQPQCIICEPLRFRSELGVYFGFLLPFSLCLLGLLLASGLG
jgi:hypothetical protein